jgi:iron-sulfur cluster insertion protein
MSVPAPLQEDELIVTDAAARKVYALIQDEGDASLVLRVFITGGGCSGFQYGFSFEEQVNDDDLVIEKRGFLEGDAPSDSHDALQTASENTAQPADNQEACVRVVVDMMSFQYLQGAEIDYREDISGAQFIIRNPNAKTTCGCGQSFSAEG